MSNRSQQEKKLLQAGWQVVESALYDYPRLTARTQIFTEKQLISLRDSLCKALSYLEEIPAKSGVAQTRRISLHRNMVLARVNRICHWGQDVFLSDVESLKRYSLDEILAQMEEQAEPRSAVRQDCSSNDQELAPARRLANLKPAA